MYLSHLKCSWHTIRCKRISQAKLTAVQKEKGIPLSNVDHMSKYTTALGPQQSTMIALLGIVHFTKQNQQKQIMKLFVYATVSNTPITENQKFYYRTTMWKFKGEQ